MYDLWGAIVIAGVKDKADARMCVVCRGYKTHEEELEKGDFCTPDRFSTDGARTRATRVIRWRVLVVRAAKVETERRRAGRPGDSRMHGKTVCVCRCALCVPEGGDLRAVSPVPHHKWANTSTMARAGLNRTQTRGFGPVR